MFNRRRLQLAHVDLRERRAGAAAAAAGGWAPADSAEPAPGAVVARLGSLAIYGFYNNWQIARLEREERKQKAEAEKPSEKS